MNAQLNGAGGPGEGHTINYLIPEPRNGPAAVQTFSNTTLNPGGVTECSPGVEHRKRSVGAEPWETKPSIILFLAPQSLPTK